MPLDWDDSPLQHSDVHRITAMMQGIQQACLQAVRLSCARIAENHLPVSSVRMEAVLVAALACLDTSKVRVHVHRPRYHHTAFEKF